ncbi:hypothetical protein C0J52_14332 [Blattella germanica]|nr:hypothetical protein C0J52_14332 [Blattella germanica]
MLEDDQGIVHLFRGEKHSKKCRTVKKIEVINTCVRDGSRVMFTSNSELRKEIRVSLFQGCHILLSYSPYPPVTIKSENQVSGQLNIKESGISLILLDLVLQHMNISYDPGRLHQINSFDELINSNYNLILTSQQDIHRKYGDNLPQNLKLLNNAKDVLLFALANPETAIFLNEEVLIVSELLERLDESGISMKIANDIIDPMGLKRWALSKVNLEEEYYKGTVMIKSFENIIDDCEVDQVTEEIHHFDTEEVENNATFEDSETVTSDRAALLMIPASVIHTNILEEEDDSQIQRQLVTSMSKYTETGTCGKRQAPTPSEEGKKHIASEIPDTIIWNILTVLFTKGDSVNEGRISNILDCVVATCEKYIKSDSTLLFSTNSEIEEDEHGIVHLFRGEKHSRKCRTVAKIEVINTCVRYGSGVMFTSNSEIIKETGVNEFQGCHILLHYEHYPPLTIKSENHISGQMNIKERGISLTLLDLVLQHMKISHGVKLPRTTKLRCVILSWIMFALAINTVYQTFVTSFMVDPGRLHQINSYDELINSKYNLILTTEQDVHRKYENNLPQNLKLVSNAKDVLLFALANPETAIFLNEEILIVTELLGRLDESGISMKIVNDIIDPIGLQRWALSKVNLEEEYVTMSLLHLQSAFIFLFLLHARDVTETQVYRCLYLQRDVTKHAEHKCARALPQVQIIWNIITVLFSKGNLVNEGRIPNILDCVIATCEKYIKSDSTLLFLTNSEIEEDEQGMVQLFRGEKHSSACRTVKKIEVINTCVRDGSGVMFTSNSERRKEKGVNEFQGCHILLYYGHYPPLTIKSENHVSGQMNIKERGISLTLLNLVLQHMNISYGVKLPRTSKLRCVIISWIMFALAINTVYQTFVTSFMVDPGRLHQINSYDELINSKYNLILTIEQDIYTKYGENLPQNLKLLNNAKDALLFALAKAETAIFLNEEILIVSELLERLDESGISIKIANDIIDPMGLKRWALSKVNLEEEYVTIENLLKVPRQQLSRSTILWYNRTEGSITTAFDIIHHVGLRRRADCN